MQPPVKGCGHDGPRPRLQRTAARSRWSTRRARCWTPRSSIRRSPSSKKQEAIDEALTKLIDRVRRAPSCHRQRHCLARDGGDGRRADSEVPGGVSYMIVNEAGASVYSASKLAAEEFPQYDVNLRSRGFDCAAAAGPAGRAGKDRPEGHRRRAVSARYAGKGAGRARSAAWSKAASTRSAWI